MDADAAGQDQLLHCMQITYLLHLDLTGPIQQYLFSLLLLLLDDFLLYFLLRSFFVSVSFFFRNSLLRIPSNFIP
jgi:hypothetical protein